MSLMTQEKGKENSLDDGTGKPQCYVRYVVCVQQSQKQLV